ncbi:YhcH/YjgK/YiaL family protein [bacterium]|nr:YhcH/YjgK/YiaL family protein [bacterium]
MIKDSLEYIKNYFGLSDKIKLGLQYLAETDFSKLEKGKYEILGNEVFVNIQDYDTKPKNEGKWEAHRKYIDIQYIISGSEKIGVGSLKDFSSLIPYDDQKDLEFLETKKRTQFIDLGKKEFMILYPNDVHMPQIIRDDSSKHVRKAVLKILSDN